MASRQILVPKGTWVKITTTEKNGSIMHLRGRSKVVYLEAETAPTGLDENTPVMEFTYITDDFPFFDVKEDEFIFAYADTHDVILTIS